VENSVAVDVPIRGTWTVLPAPDSAAVKTLEKARRDGELALEATAMTDSARIAGAH
jgi:hypothetical protein